MQIDRFGKFSLAIATINKIWHNIAAKEMEKYGLKGIHSIYILTMAKYPDGITATKLCEVCDKDKADVSRMMNILEQNGFVHKEGNNYRAIFKLTSSGYQLAQEVNDKANKAVAMAGKDLSDLDREVLYHCLDSIIANLKVLNETGIDNE
ncbi:MAG: MarR family winged helix-turn-helix transcriptional regulator, partial [Traorella sp.]